MAAICAAPLALAAHGALEEKKATIYPGMGPALAMEFALALVEFIKGAEAKKEVATGILYDKIGKI